MQRLRAHIVGFGSEMGTSPRLFPFASNQPYCKYGCRSTLYLCEVNSSKIFWVQGETPFKVEGAINYSFRLARLFSCEARWPAYPK